jgi:hypothetical protein
MLMGEDNAGVNLIAGGEDREETEDENEAEGEYEWEYEDGGWWVGTVSMMEVPGWTGEASDTIDGLISTQSGGQDGVKGDGQAERESEFQVNECSEGEMAGDEWWDLEPDCPNLEEGGAGAPRVGPPQHLPHGLARPDRLAATGQQKFRKRPRVTADQQWEEARQSAWLRQLLSDGSSNEDEDEERYGRFAESGRWMSELYGLPQHSTTSGGECSG